MRTNDIFLIPFSLLWCGFAVFWFVGALTAGISVWFALVGLPFVAIGLMFVFGRFILDARARAHTYYGLTHDRIIIKSGVHKTSVTSIPLATLTKIEYGEKKYGTGTITLGPKNPMMTWGRGMHWWVGIKPGSSLELIQDV
ncbi:MAG TPA: hypothetical protein DCF44_03760, partial [Chitinophagaceae bacterium]|nr:hypothetical protein [Chitinophagaceae bacterium]